MRDYFWEDQPETNDFFEDGGKIAHSYHNGGLAIGYARAERSSLTNGLGTGFWADVRKTLSLRTGYSPFPRSATGISG